MYLLPTREYYNRAEEYSYERQLVSNDSTTIRLIELLPGNNDAKLRCRLKYVSLDDDPEYEAISYCWGKEDKSIILECNGRNLLITPNLAKALRRFRAVDGETVVLWADAVCINQKNIAEKNDQLMLMSRTYKQARRVKVWLGDEDATMHSSAAFSLLQTLARAAEQLGDDVYQLQMFSSRLQAYHIPAFTDPAWQSLSILMDRPWFYRVWIIQEVVLAKTATMFWGSSVLSWEECRAGIELTIVSGATRIMPGVTRSGFSIGRATNLLGQLTYTQEEYLENGDGYFDLLFLLRHHRGASATDPLDKVYALLGLSNTENGKGAVIKPDYRLDPAVAYIKVAKRILQLSETLDILSVSKATSTVLSQDCGIEGLPSWVPDWTIPATGGDMCFKLASGKYFRTFNASRNSEIQKSVSFNGDILVLQGLLFDEIADVGDLMRLDHNYSSGVSGVGYILADYARIMAVWSNWRQISGYNIGGSYPTGEDIQDAFIKTVFLGEFPRGESLESAKELDARQHSHEKWLGVSRTLGFQSHSLLAAASTLITQMLSPVPVDPNASIHLANCRSACTDMRRMIRTSGGYIGLAAASVQHNDRIFLVKGSRAPLLLRWVQGSWQLVGDCYVHGIMQGEAFEESVCKRIHVE